MSVMEGSVEINPSREHIFSSTIIISKQQ